MGLSLYRRHFISAAVLAGFAGLSPTGLAAQAKTILVLGDSLSAEYGLKRGSGWVALLAQKLSLDKPAFTVVNASISGDTTSGGVSRLPALLALHRPSVVVIELGSNDALRGLPLAQTRLNLNRLTQLAQQSGAKVLLVGMQVPPNYGQDYTERFAGVFADLAKTNQTGLVPFMLKGIADQPDSTAWFQADRLHPTEAAHPKILGNVWPELRKLLK
jgi:acyl-CoA thioesterase-1